MAISLIRKLFERYAKRQLTFKVRPKITEEGIMTIPNEQRVKKWADNLYKELKAAGVTDDMIKTENDIKILHRQVAEINNQQIARKFKDLMEESTFFNPEKSADVLDLTGKKIDTSKPILGGKNVPETEAEIVARMNKQNKESIERLKNKKLEDPEDLAYGGLAGMLGERTGYANGRWIDPGKSPGTSGDYRPGQGHREDRKPHPYTPHRRVGGDFPPSLRTPELREENRRAQEEAKFEAMWRGAPPSMGEREKMFRKERTARLLEEQRIKDFEKKIKERKKRFPYADMTEAEFAKLHPKVYDFMKKDPNWDWETFQKVSFANPGETFQATGARDIGLPLGRTDRENLDLFMTPFGEDTYEMSSMGPFNKTKIMSDQEKAQVALHEMRHKKILTEPRLTEAQPPLAVEVSKLMKSQPGRMYPGSHMEMPLKYRHANPPGSKEEFSNPLDMHEVFTRFMDRQYGHLKTPSGPYFDKIWRDEWQPYAKDYERILKEEKPEPLGLAGGGLAPLLGEPTYADDNHRVPYGKGKLVDIARRKFLQLVGAGAAGTVAAKSGLLGLLKSGKPSVIKELTSVPIKSGVDGMPVWFKPLVNQVIKKGTEVESAAERVIVHKAKLPNSKTDIYVSQDLSTGGVEIQIGAGKHGFPDGHLGQPVRLEYRASEVIEPDVRTWGRTDEIPTGKVVTGKESMSGAPRKTKEEFWVEEAEFTGGHPENIKFEESTIEKFGQHGSDFSEVEKFATGKIKKKTAKESIKAERAHWTPEGDMASGGRVPLSGGGILKLLKLFKTKPETLKEFIDRRNFLKLMIGNTDNMKNKRMLEEILEETKKVKGFEFPETGVGSDIHKEITTILSKDITKHASGGRVPLFGGGAAKKLWQEFIEKLFIKSSNEIRQGKGIWQGLTQDQWIKQHHNLTKKLKEWKMGGKKALPPGMKEYFGMNEIQLANKFKIETGQIQASRPTKTLEGIEKTGTIDISNPGIAEEFSRFMKETDPKGFKELEQKIQLESFDPKGKKGHASGGIAGMLGE